MTPVTQETTHLLNILDRDLGIDEKYKHAPKQVTPGEPLEAIGLVLKWYAIHPQDRHVPAEITQLARAYLTSKPLEARGFGFVLLHRCGNDFYFLISTPGGTTTNFGRPFSTKMATR